jgi:hypothetical protein
MGRGGGVIVKREVDLLDDVQRELEGIRECVAKRNYLNALARSSHLTLLLTKLFSAVLKERL